MVGSAFDAQDPAPPVADSPSSEDLPHILVVDDDRRLRELLRRFLSENSFRVSTAGDAAEARARMAGVPYDPMVLDVMLPGASGHALTHDLRPGDSANPLPILPTMAAHEPRIARPSTRAGDTTDAHRAARGTARACRTRGA